MSPKNALVGQMPCPRFKPRIFGTQARPSPPESSLMGHSYVMSQIGSHNCVNTRQWLYHSVPLFVKQMSCPLFKATTLWTQSGDYNSKSSLKLQGSCPEHRSGQGACCCVERVWAHMRKLRVQRSPSSYLEWLLLLTAVWKQIVLCRILPWYEHHRLFQKGMENIY